MPLSGKIVGKDFECMQTTNPASKTCQCSVRIRGLSVKKHDGLILDHIDLEVRHGEILALIGRNGAGKTTLLKALLGRCAYTGEIIFHNGRGERVQKPKIGYVPQRLDFDRSAPVTAADLLCANHSRRPVWLGNSGGCPKKSGYDAEKSRRKPLTAAQTFRQPVRWRITAGTAGFALDPMPDLLLLDEPVSAVDRKGISLF